MSRTRELPTFHFINDECETRTLPRKPELEPREFGDKGVSRDRVLNPRMQDREFARYFSTRSLVALDEQNERFLTDTRSFCSPRADDEKPEKPPPHHVTRPTTVVAISHVRRTMCEMEEPYFLSVHRNRRRTFDGEITSKFRAEELVATRERRGKGEKPYRVTPRYNLYERRERTE